MNKTEQKTAGTGKLGALWSDRRPFSVRLITSLLVGGAFAFTFFVFGPYELYIQSVQYLTFDFSYLVLPMALCGLAFFVLSAGLLLVLRGKLHNYAVSALFSVTLLGWLQGNFINIDHGALDGSTVEWSAYAIPALLNAVLWLAVAVAVFALMYFSRKVWTITVRLVCIAIIGAQLIALVSILPTAFSSRKDQDLYISDKDLYKLSDKKNVVVFLLDRMDKVFMDGMLERYPEWKDNELGGFTFYRNFTGSYTRTMPSVCYLLTGVVQDYSMPPDEYFTKAWTESTFLSDIKNAGYGARIYSELAYVFGKASNLNGKADNLVRHKTTVDYSLMLTKMLKLSAYRYSPEAFKPYFRIYTGDLAAIATVDDESAQMHVTDDCKFWENFRNEGLTIDDTSKGEFVFYHFSGAHDPYYIDENAQRVVTEGYNSSSEAMYAQITGDMTQMFRYFNAMKEAGVYDDTTIIITADHGRTGTLTYIEECSALPNPPVTTLMIKPAGNDGSEPLKFSDKQACQDNLRASIISYFGLDTTAYGRTIEDIGEDEDVTRIFRMQSCRGDLGHRDVDTVVYEVTGDANDFSNWHIKEIIPIKYPFYDKDKK